MVSLIDKNREALIKLCRAHHVRRLDVFGSAATDDFDSSSDIDFLVEFEDTAAPRRFDNYFDLHRALEKLFARPIDLVEPGGLSNPYFIHQVNATRRQIYAAP
ncbi:MAG: nucleotidyltransferase domain-containing protein [Phycisphaerales bacterium]|nr:MAG: nucleotidyltransferase domain-containing protein [Phycisphaerales bacterium]